MEADSSRESEAQKCGPVIKFWGSEGQRCCIVVKFRGPRRQACCTVVNFKNRRRQYAVLSSIWGRGWVRGANVLCCCQFKGIRSEKALYCHQIGDMISRGRQPSESRQATIRLIPGDHQSHAGRQEESPRAARKVSGPNPRGDPRRRRAVLSSSLGVRGATMMYCR